MILHNKKKRGGFTLVETLVVVGIIVVLLALAAVGVLAWRSHLKLLELDNAAREIYMAAQNRMELLNSGGRVPLAAGDSNQIDGTLRYLKSGSDDMKVLLPAGTIDPTLTDGDNVFYVVYDPNSGSVTDVFYAEGDFPSSGTFTTFYKTDNNYKKDTRRAMKPMVGYYGGNGGDPGDAVMLDAPLVIIHNEEELWAEINWAVPTSKQGEVELEVVLTYGESPHQQDVVLDPVKRRVERNSKSSNGKIYTQEKYVIDSLEPGNQFKDLKDWKTPLGGEFTLTARLVPANGESGVLPTVEGRDTDNSLFAESTNETSGPEARIANMRHLQNLEPNFSCDPLESLLDTISTARQIASFSNIQVNGAAHDFRPINNSALTEYDGASFEIRDLYSSNPDDKEYVGLFGEAASNANIKNIRLVNARVSDDDSGRTATTATVGALCGNAKNAAINNCWSYWEKDAGSSSPNLQYLLGAAYGEDDADPYIVTGKDYAVTGNIAGGLVGHAQDTTFTECLAAATVKGDSVTGGLVGAMEINIPSSVADPIIKDSYADCYLAVGSDPTAAAATGSVAGMVGELTGDATITGSYTAGFIYAGEFQSAAGFCLGAGSPVIDNSYSAMIYNELTTSTYLNRYTLAQSGSGTNAFYLTSDYNRGTGTFSNGKAEGYNTLIDRAKWSDSELFGPYCPFTAKKNRTTNPYSLRTDNSLSGMTYPFPGIGKLDHYGDWGISLENGGLVYADYYADGSYGLAGSGFMTLQDGAAALEIVRDKYGLVLSKTQEQWLEAGNTITITPTLDGTALTPFEVTQADYQTVKSGSPTERLIKVMIKEDRYVVILPEALLNLVKPTASFYHTLECKIKSSTGSSSEASWFYNPHFAATVVEKDAGETAENLSKTVDARIRTPRHLYWLSQSGYYFNSSNAYTFGQEKDLDYNRGKLSGKYTYKLDPTSAAEFERQFHVKFMESQQPIGPDEAHPFSERYNGGGHTVTGAPVTPTVNATGRNTTEVLGLFGVNASAISDLAWLGNGKTDVIGSARNVLTLKGTANANYATVMVGGLVGLNNGTISNCAAAYMKVEANAVNYAAAYTGGLVGANNGMISNCSAAADRVYIDALYSDAYAGGLVGLNGAEGNILNSYAVGHVQVDRKGDQEALAGGLAGSNRGSISRCYAACRLTVSGGALEYGLCGGSASMNSYCLDEGNFTWLGETYSARYDDTAGKSALIHWTGLANLSALKYDAGAPDSGKAARLGSAFVMLERDAADYSTVYPMPAVVTGVRSDGTMGPVHYGPWPQQMDIGTIGVFYWEKEANLNADGTANTATEALHFSVICLDTVNKKAWKDSTLCTAYNDGKVITEFGYGYYYKDGTTLEKFDTVNDTTNFATIEGISVIDPEKRNVEEVAKDFNKLVGDNYTFKAFRTTQRWKKTPEVKDTTLLLKANESANTYQYGIWTITVDGVSYKFNLTPYFGDAFALAEAPNGWTSVDTKLIGIPGQAEELAYQVRSVEQLQYINWNGKDRLPNKAALNDSDKYYPYLCYANNAGKNYTEMQYWVQSHDVQGAKDPVTGEPVKYVPIGAGANDATVLAWFGGSYDGSGHAISNMDITSTERTVGLFGVTVNADLKNIVMYSPDSTAKVTRENGSGWYALGGLVGLAVNTKDSTTVVISDHKIENCSVSGYEILDKSGNIGNAKGGGGVGGLVGICNMALSDCTAVNTIKLDYRHNDLTKSLRVGGLAGSCQNSITNCYAGGEIEKISANSVQLHIGGIVGGVYMKFLTIHNGGEIEIAVPQKDAELGRIDGSWIAENPIRITNCYSYTALPDIDVENRDGNDGRGQSNSGVNHLYAIGGAGEFVQTVPVEINNCYYLRSNVLKNISGTEEERAAKLCDRHWETDASVNPKTYKIYRISDPEHYVALAPKENYKTGDIHGDGGQYDAATKTVSDPNYNSADPRYNPVALYLTYPEMEGDTALTINGVPYGNFIEALNAGNTGRHFAPVTNTAVNGESVKGKYSYGGASWLEGLDYPFPTILYQGPPEANLHVHYGEWPVAGLQRQDGAGNAEPISVGLFADYHGTDGSYVDIPLTLSDVMRSVQPNGTLKVEVAQVDDPADPSKKINIASAKLLDKDGSEVTGLPLTGGGYDFILRVTWLAEGDTTLTVTYGDSVGNAYDELTLGVISKRELRLNPALENPKYDDKLPNTETNRRLIRAVGEEPVVFRGLTSQIALYAFDVMGDSLDPALNGAVTIDVKSVTTDDSRLQITRVERPAGAKATDCLCRVSVKAGGEGDDPATLLVTYSYTYAGKTYDATGNIIVYPRDLKVEATPQTIYFLEDPVTKPVKDVLSFKVGGAAVSIDALQDLKISEFSSGTAVKVAVTDAGLEFQPNAGLSATTTETAELPVSFTYGLAKHSDCTAEVPVTVEKHRLTVGNGAGPVTEAAGLTLTVQNGSLTSIGLNVGLASYTGTDAVYTVAFTGGLESYFEITRAADGTCTISQKGGAQPPAGTLGYLEVTAVYTASGKAITDTLKIPVTVSVVTTPQPGGDPGYNEGPGIVDPSPTEPPAEPNAEPSETDPNMEPSTDPSATEPNAEPQAEPSADPNAEPPAEPNTDPAPQNGLPEIDGPTVDALPSPQNGLPEIDGPTVDALPAPQNGLPEIDGPTVDALPSPQNGLPEIDGPVVDALPAPQDGLPEIGEPDAGAPESAPAASQEGLTETGGQPEEAGGVPEADELPPSAPVAALPPRQETGETPKGSSGPEGGGDPGQPSEPEEGGGPAS